METFRVRLNCIDHYQATPTDFDPPVPVATARNNVKDRPKISVIRVFGATETGQKVLMHIHGALQYAYIEYSGSLRPEDVDVAIRTLQLSIDHALAVSYRKNAYDGKHFYVAHISLVKGIPFYGYHVGYKFYLKIYLLNPMHMTRLADLLREGAVMKRVLQPYESHMQYLAQWMCDYNLYGCAYIDCEKVKFRGPLPNYLELSSARHQWHDRSVMPESVSDEALLPKQSQCSLEVDLCVQDILNRRGLEARALHHDFVERLHPLPMDAKLVQSMAGLWKDETRRRKARMGLTDLKSSPFPAEVLVTMSADPRNHDAGGWIHEDEYRAKVAEIATEERVQSDARELSFDTFIQRVPLEDRVKTALESIDDLWLSNLSPAFTNGNEHSEGPERVYSTDAPIVVDEGRILDVTIHDFSSSDELQATSYDRTIELNHSNGAITVKSSLKVQEAHATEITPPLSSSEFESCGIRKAGDFSHIVDDAFYIPRRYTSKHSLGTDIAQDSRLPMNIDQPAKPRKRRKLLTDGNDILQEFDEGKEGDEGISTVDRPLSCQMTAHPKKGNPGLVSDNLNKSAVLQIDQTTSGRLSQLRTRGSQRQDNLHFSIVKEPNDPETVLRLSQQSSSSQKKSQEVRFKDEHVVDAQAPHRKTATPATTGSSFEPANEPANEPASMAPLFPKDLAKHSSNTSLWMLLHRAPSLPELRAMSNCNNFPDVIYQDAFYSYEDDVPDRPREYAGREFKLESTTVPFLPDFDPSGTSAATIGRKEPSLVDEPAEERADMRRRRACRLSQWNILELPPPTSEIVSWVRDVLTPNTATKHSTSPSKKKDLDLSQIDGPTQRNKHGFKYSQKQQSSSVQHETQYMSVMSLEVHVNTRGNLAPNPEEDEIQCIFWCLQSNDDEFEISTHGDLRHLGIVVLCEQPGMSKQISQNLPVEVEEESSELDVLTKIVDMVRYFDPDILTGYEVHNSSWGYLIERARLKYDMNICDDFSRMKSQSHGRFGRDEDRWGFNQTSTIRVTGRHTINIWRAMRGELNLLQYTMENVVFHLLHRRIPHFTFADLTRWYKSRNAHDLSKVLQYFVSRVQMDLEILESNELVPRTSEQARLLGVDWFSVISRGSQFKVESLMFRIAKPENFILVSPSRRQVGGQNALECLPLVMEPQSDFYTSPMLVLDFQSLYPSIMIAYNYCYSTFLGRVVSWRGTNKMGFTNYQRERRLVELLRDHINIAPNGIMYVKTHVRKSLLAKMLGEILETRVMVKSGMKLDKDDRTLQRLLNNRQLALKLIANVTYGYTSASFSGRMPCSEIADSIVQTGRETLEKAITLIHSVERWGAEVVYGDTDSLFVYLKGRSRDQAFDIGEEIAQTITKMNPRPVKLKFEKVYHPCVLLAKKRYVGFKYESRHQRVPDFDAKGIETVRRDGTPAEQKIEENALKILFRTADLSQVKNFFQQQCSKIMKGKISIQDFCFAKEVKLGTYSDKGPPPPGALISARRMLEDPRLEPQYGERVPYVVVTGGPGARLIDRCVAPDVLLQDAQAELDAEYYISKNIIPPLERIFNLVGANVRQWYDEMPKYQRIRRIDVGTMLEGKEQGLTKKTLESYMKSSTCLVCRKALDMESPLCHSCFDQAPQSLLILQGKLVKAERRAVQLNKMCRSCSGLGWNEDVRCDSKDCPVFYSRTRQKADLGSTRALIEPAIRLLEEKEHLDMDW